MKLTSALALFAILVLVAAAAPLTDFVDALDTLDSDLNLQDISDQTILEDADDDDTFDLADDTIRCLSNQCAPGTYPGSRARCQECPKGRYNNICIRVGLCNLCSGGRTTAGTGSKSSEDCFCPPNAYWSERSGKCTGCPAGTKFTPRSSKPAANSLADCTPCSAGTAPQFSSVGEGCIPCARGTFAKSAGSAMCTACSSGFIASAQGLTSCTKCPSGTVSKGIGGTDSRGILCELPANTATPAAQAARAQAPARRK